MVGFLAKLHPYAREFDHAVKNEVMDAVLKLLRGPIAEAENRGLLGQSSRHHKLSSKPTAGMTHARSGLVQRKSLLGSGAPRASEAEGLRSDLVIDLTALADNPHPASISRFKHIEPRVRAAEFLPVYAAQFVIGSLHNGSGTKESV